MGRRHGERTKERKMAKIANGIPGIRSIKAANRKGWHIFTVDKYVTFLDETFADIVNDLEGTVIDVTGNGIVFEN
jgi:hypothetical protein